MTIKDLSETIIAQAKEGEDISQDLLELAQQVGQAAHPLPEPERALSMEAAAWFVGQRAANAAVYMSEAFLQLSRSLDAARLLTNLSRREPFRSFAPLIRQRDHIAAAVSHSYDFNSWRDVQNAMVFGPRDLGRNEEYIIERVVELAPDRLLSLFSGDGLLEEKLLERLPDLVVVFGEFARFDDRFMELSVKFPGRVLSHTVTGRYDFSRETYDVCILHRLEMYADLGATLAYAFDRAPALFTYALHASRFPPMGSVTTPGGSRFLALHGLDPHELGLIFESLGLKPNVVDIDGLLVAEVRLEAQNADPDSGDPGPQNPSQK